MPAIRVGSRGAIGAIDPLKPTKVTPFTVILYNSENNISKTLPNKSFVTFELFHCLQQAVLSSIVLSQQCYEVQFIYLAVAKPLRDLIIKYY